MYMYTVDGQMVNLLQSQSLQDPYTEFETENLNELAYSTVVEHFNIVNPFFAILGEIRAGLEQTDKPKKDIHDALKDLLVNTPQFEEKVGGLINTTIESSRANSDDTEDSRKEKQVNKAKMMTEIRPALEVIAKGLRAADEPMGVFMSIIRTNMDRLRSLQQFIDNARAQMQSYLNAIRERQDKIQEAIKKQLPDPQIPPIEIPEDVNRNMMYATQIQGQVSSLVNIYNMLQREYNGFKSQYDDVRGRIDRVRAKLDQA